MITGELGNVTPFIVVPGNWTDEELTYQAKSILSGLLLNSSHNCLALEVSDMCKMVLLYLYSHKIPLLTKLEENFPVDPVHMIFILYTTLFIMLVVFLIM